jgi:hypothetical protein
MAIAPRLDGVTLRSAVVRSLFDDWSRVPAGAQAARRDWGRPLQGLGAAFLDAWSRFAGVVAPSARRRALDGTRERLMAVMQVLDQLEWLYARLGDDHSRRVLVELLCMHVLGPDHPQLRRGDDECRRHQLQAQRYQTEASFPGSVLPGYASYRVPVRDADIYLAAPAAQVVRTFLLGQYRYARGGKPIGVEAGDIVVDVGTVSGDSSLFFASQTGPTGRVYILTDVRGIVGPVHSNLSLNPTLQSRTSIITAAVGPAFTGSYIVKHPDEYWCGFGIGGRGDIILHIPETSIDEIACHEGIHSMNVLKIDDPERSLDILAGADQLIRTCRSKLIVAIDRELSAMIPVAEYIDIHYEEYSLYLDACTMENNAIIMFAEPS